MTKKHSTDEGKYMEFGQLEDVDLRKAWESEPQDFTPWLAENLDRLSTALNIHPPLELISSEFAVGDHSADIVARAAGTAEIAVIENQLERSDHGHLGQVLTYLAGTQAKIVVWVAREFREEHLSAIRWLNDHTSSEFAFFAVRVRVIQIGQSPFAPVFDVLERPSEWERTVRSNIARDESETTKFRREFWSHFRKRYPDHGVSERSATSVVWLPRDANNLIIALSLAKDGVRIWLRGQGGELLSDVEERIALFKDNLASQAGLQVGDPVKTGAYPLGGWERNTSNHGNWNEMVDWLNDQILACQRVLETPQAQPGSN